MKPNNPINREYFSINEMKPINVLILSSDDSHCNNNDEVTSAEMER